MLKVFASFDVKAAAFGTPIFLPTSGLAIRMFSDSCADPRSPMAQHPADYTLLELGTYDPNTGRLESHPQPLWLASAADIISKKVKERLAAEPELPIKELSK